MSSSRGSRITLAEPSTSTRRVLKEGTLNKRCRWCWRPRYVELVQDPPALSGPQYNFFLLIYDHCHRAVKNKIRINDVVTIRAGKQFSFQVYLSTGMFVLFRTDSTECQSSWMASIKMALGRGNIFHVQVNTPTTGYTLEHALLYCIGVNLPSHRVGQLDRVLVLASPITDVNMQAWNLNRLIGFHVIEAGIQMVLCPTCMGHRKNIITFLLPPHFKKECIEFLLREIHVHKIVRNVSPGPIYHYSVTHQCGSNPAPSYPAPTHAPPASPSPAAPPPASPPPSYNLSEQIAITPPSETEEHTFLSPDYANVAQWLTHGDEMSSTSGTTTHTHDGGKRRPPPVPPRDIPRPMPQPYLRCTTQVLHHQPTAISSRSRTFASPYSISHRVFIDSKGHVRRESHLLGSGSGEFRLGPPVGSAPLLTPPRSTPPSKQKGDPPLYRNFPSNGSSPGATCLPTAHRSTVSQGSRPTGAVPLQQGFQQSVSRRRSDSEASHGRPERSAIYPSFSLPSYRYSATPPSSYAKLSATTDISTEVSWGADSHDYQNYRPGEVDRSPSPCMCTDELSDISLAATFRVGPLPTLPRTPSSFTASHNKAPTECKVSERSNECPDYCNVEGMREFSALKMAADYQNTGLSMRPPVPTPRRRVTMETEVILVPAATKTLSIIERTSPDSSHSNLSACHTPDLPEKPPTSFTPNSTGSHSPNILPEPAPRHCYFSNSAESSPVLPRKLNRMVSRSSTSLPNPESKD